MCIQKQSIKKLFFCLLSLISLLILPRFKLYSQLKEESLSSFSIEPKGLKISFDINNKKTLRLISFLPSGVTQTKVQTGYEVFLHCTGENQDAHHGTKLAGGNPGNRLLFVDKKEINTNYGKKIVIIQFDTVKNLKVESFYEYSDASPTVRRYTKVTNEGNVEIGVEYLSSAILNNFNNTESGKPENNLRIHYAYNSWQSEAQWHVAKLSEFGWNDNGTYNTTGVILSNLGSWSTARYLPMGMIENTKTGIIWFWQIEHNGSWYVEMGNVLNNSNYLYLGGPDAVHSQAWKNLKPGEVYQTVPVALGCVKGSFDEAVAALTNYRRAMVIKPHTSYAKCSVIFNDYMNCLWGDPSTEKELPIIDAAAKAGCDYYVIDCGWYAEKGENWWESVGLWQPSKTRFSGGLQAVLNYIKQKGMIPGLWLEPEVIGLNSTLKSKPDSWFLMQHGKRIIDNGRFMLNFRNQEVTTFITSVVDRMVNEYGVGYIKMDYNNSAAGTQTIASDLGQGLLEHNRAVVNWFKSITDKYPNLVVENCGSGGLRMDYAMLSQTQIQSSSDQEDYRKYPAILVGAMAAVVPEQLAVWSYPKLDGDAKQASFNMVSSMLCRVEQSGNIDKLSPQSLEQVTRGIEIYKSTMALFIPQAVPFFPLGMPSIVDTLSPIAVGIRKDSIEYIAVWRLKGKQNVTIPSSSESSVQLLYPEKLNITLSKNKKSIIVKFPDVYMGAILKVTK